MIRLFLLLFILAACQGKSENKNSSEKLVETKQVVNLATLEEKEIDFDQFDGEILILNIWATWCKPCIAEMPSLVEMKKSLPGNMKLLLASEEPIDRQLNFIERKSYDLEFVKLNTSLSALGVYALPTTVIIKDGEIIDRLVGAREWDTPEQIEELKSYLK